MGLPQREICINSDRGREREREGGRQMARQDKRGTRFEMLIVVKLGIIVKSNKDGNRCISY